MTKELLKIINVVFSRKRLNGDCYINFPLVTGPALAVEALCATKARSS